MAGTKVALHQGLEWYEWIWEKPVRYREQGVDVLPMIGAPRDNPAQHVLEASQRAAGCNTDIDIRGTADFRKAVSGMLSRDLGITADPEREVIATNGAMNAIFITLASVLRAGEEVIIPTPHFYYWNSIEILNGVPVLVPCSEADTWAWDFEAVEEAVTPQTRAILFTNPCNPTGFMPTEEHLLGLGEIAQRHDLILIEDATYAKFTHCERPITTAGSIPELWPRTILCYSFHKNYTLHAWRAGFLTGPAHLVEPALSVAVWVNLRVNHITQAAAAAALAGPSDWMENVIRPYREGRNLLLESLAGDPGISMTVPTQGGTMGFISVEGLGLRADEAAERLLAEYGVPTVPCSCFGPMRHSGEQLRVSFALAHDYRGSYQEVVDRLTAASAEIRGG